jgi:hypothetical protein
MVNNETERFLAERAGIQVCECGGFMVLPTYWDNTNPPLICQECGEYRYTLIPGVTYEQRL